MQNQSFAGRPVSQSLENVQVYSWTSEKNLIPLMDYFVKNGRIKQLQLCGVAFKQAIKNLVSLNSEEESDEENYKIEKSKELLKIFSNDLIQKIRIALRAFNFPEGKIFYLEKKVKYLQFDKDDEDLKINSQVDLYFHQKLKNLQSEILNNLSGNKKRQFDFSKLQEYISNQKNTIENQLYGLMLQLKYQNSIHFLRYQLNDNTIEMLEDLAYKLIENKEFTVNQLLGLIKTNYQTRKKYAEFIDCQSIKKFLSKQLYLKNQIEQNNSKIRYENLKKEMNCIVDENCDPKILREKTLKSREFKRNLSQLLELVKNIVYQPQ